MTQVNPALAAYPNDLKLTTWNAMLLPQLLYPNYGQEQRARLIADAPILQEQDVVVFQELQDNSSSELLLAQLQTRFKYQTPVVGRSQSGWDSTEGWSNNSPEDGGVAIASRWPIVERRQYLFRTAGCSWEQYALKGFAYVKLQVNDQYYHLVGTHLQSEDSGCNDHWAVRQAQLREISDWLVSRNLPKDEVVLIAGDMNIDRRNTEQYSAMLDILQASEPRYAGVSSSFDTLRNGLALERYGARSGDDSEYLDYILTLKDHRQPDIWHNLALDAPAPQWRVQSVGGYTYAYTDYSDHYPVQAFAWADANTPTQSFTDQDGSYRQIGLQSLSNGQWLQAANTNDGWLKTGPNSQAAQFNLSNNFAMRDNGCLRDGDYLRVERADRPGWFWTWWGGLGANQYAYYTVQGALNASTELRLQIHNRPDGCLQDGDLVSFKDWARQGDYYLTVWNGGTHDGKLYLWQPSVGSGESFIVSMPRTQQLLDWEDMLLYRDNRRLLN